MKTTLLFALPCVALVVCGCNSTAPRPSARRGPVWVVPATPAFPSPSSAATNQVSVPAPATAILPALPTNAPPVANVLSVSDIKEMAVKGVSEQTILNALRASRAIYTLTTKDVTELREAKVSSAVTDYLLSTPLLYKDDLLRYRSYYYYAPLYPGYWHWSFHDDHHGLYHYDPHHSYSHDPHHGGLHH